MNRNFGTAILLIWISCYIISVSGEQVGAAKAELAGKISIVFFWIWLPIFVLIVLHALYKYSKEEENPLEKWK